MALSDAGEGEPDEDARADLGGAGGLDADRAEVGSGGYEGAVAVWRRVADRDDEAALGRRQQHVEVRAADSHNAGIVEEIELEAREAVRGIDAWTRNYDVDSEGSGAGDLSACLDGTDNPG